jgi:hypothetical protein
MAILHLKKKIALGDFLHVIHNKPVASALLVQWCKVKKYPAPCLYSLWAVLDSSMQWMPVGA